MESLKIFATMSLQDLISSPLQKIQAQMKKTERTSGSLTSRLASLGKAMLPLAAAAGIVLGAIGATAVKAAEFEQSMAGVSTMFGGVAVDTANLNDKVLQLSSSTGIVAAELGGSLYNALSAGIPVTKDMTVAMDFMTRASRLAKAGFTDVDTAVQATASVLNAYKMNVSETDRVHKILMQTQNKGIVTIGDLGQTLSQVTPTAAAMSVSFEQIGASLANLTSAKVPAAQAATQLNAIIAELGKQGTMAQKNLMDAARGTQYAGMGFQDMMKAGVPLSDILDVMGRYAQKSNKSLIDMFSSIDAGKAALTLSGANAEQFKNNLVAMGTSADVVGDAYNKVTETLSGSMGKLSTSFSAFLITVGQIFIPAMKTLANILTVVTQALRALADTKVGAFILKTIGYIAAFIAVTGTLIGVFLAVKVAIIAVGSVIGGVAVALMGLGTVGTIISGIISIVSIGFYALGVAISASIFPITIIVGALALIGAALYIFRDKIKNVILIVKGVFAVFMSLKDGVGAIRGELAKKIEANGLVGVITTICKTLYAGYNTIKNIFGSIKSFFVSISEFFKNIFTNIDLSDIGAKLLTSYIDGVMAPFNAAKSIFMTIKDFFSNIFNGMSFFDAGKKLIDTFADGLLSVINKPKELLTKGLDALRNLLPFSDAKEGPLSTLTLSGERLITTLAQGVDNAAPVLQNTAADAFNVINNDVALPDVTQNVIPDVAPVNTAVPAAVMSVNAAMPEIAVPDVMQNIIPDVAPIDTAVPAAVMNVNAAMPEIAVPDVTQNIIPDVAPINTAVPAAVMNVNAAMPDITVPDVTQNVIPDIAPFATAVPAAEMAVNPVVVSLDIPDISTVVTAKTEKTAKPNTTGTGDIIININEISLPEVKDGESFIESLRGLALSLGVHNA